MKIIKNAKGNWYLEGLGELRILIPWDYYDKMQKEDEKTLEEDKQQIENFVNRLETAEEILIFNEPEDTSYPDGIMLKTPLGIFVYDNYDALKEHKCEEFQYIGTKTYGTTFTNKQDFIMFVQNACADQRPHTTVCSIYNNERRFTTIFNN
jgi:hypothetical protein